MRIILKNERIMDRIWSVFIFFFRNNIENNVIEIVFNVEIRFIFVVDVFFNVKNWKMLKRVIFEIFINIKGSIVVCGGRIFFFLNYIIGNK